MQKETVIMHGDPRQTVSNKETVQNMYKLLFMHSCILTHPQLLWNLEALRYKQKIVSEHVL